MRTTSANNTQNDTVTWIHSDPVTGSSEHVNKDGTSWYRTEYEPLGQEISIYGNEEEFPTQPNILDPAAMRMADDPQWQCQLMDIDELSWTVPTKCGIAAIANPNFYLGADSENSPHNVTAPPPRQGDINVSGSNMPINPTPTNKPEGNASKHNGVAPACKDGDDENGNLVICTSVQKDYKEPSDDEIEAALLTLADPPAGPDADAGLIDYLLESYSNLLKNQKGLDESIYCRTELQKNLQTLKNAKIKDFSTGAKGVELGFSVDKIGNEYQISKIVTGTENSIKIPKTQFTVATFHTHDKGEFPSDVDAENADNFHKAGFPGYITYVVSANRVTLYNPTNPSKEDSNKYRKVDAPKCPKNK